MTTTPVLGMTDLTGGQSIPETTVNEHDRILEWFAAGAAIEDRDLASPPGSPADGQGYLIAASATGVWAGKDGQLALYVNTGFLYFTVKEGMRIWVKDENVKSTYNGSSWADETPGSTPTESIIIACSDETTALTAGAAKVTFRMPYGFDLSDVRGSLTTAQATDGAGGIFTVDINKGGVSILSTKLTIDNTEKTSTTAATPAVISDSALADDAEMTIDIDQIGDGTAKGLKVYLIGTRT